MNTIISFHGHFTKLRIVLVQFQSYHISTIISNDLQQGKSYKWSEERPESRSDLSGIRPWMDSGVFEVFWGLLGSIREFRVRPIRGRQLGIVKFSPRILIISWDVPNSKWSKSISIGSATAFLVVYESSFNPL